MLSGSDPYPLALQYIDDLEGSPLLDCARRARHP